MRHMENQDADSDSETAEACENNSMKSVKRSPFVDPDIAARKLAEIANGIETVQDGRIYIELVTVSGGWRQCRGLPRRDRARHCARLALAARERHLCALHPGRRGSVRANEAVN
jgi:hypothetical protein